VQIAAAAVVTDTVVSHFCSDRLKLTQYIGPRHQLPHHEDAK
jgi:hypothetical protein